jgi:sulfate permease, SulP family
VLILSQLPTTTGMTVTGANKISETINLLSNLGDADVTSFALALLTLMLAVGLPRTRIGTFGTLVAIVIPSLLAALLHLDGVHVVNDVGEIPKGIPMPSIPAFFDLPVSSMFDVITGALAVSAIILVQGTGVSQSVPNADGSRSKVSRDFVAQGAANIASGFFRGLPVGGSVGSTALSVISGARTRWAAIASGAWVAVIVILFPGPVSSIVMPALGTLLILAGVQSIKPAEARAILRTGWPSRLASVTTFLATLLLPIQAAVGLGVVLSALLYVVKSSSDIRIVELVERPDGQIEEREPTSTLAADRVTVLDVYGSLFFAGARTLERLLPVPVDGQRSAVILRLRGQMQVGATLIEVLAAYSDKLAEVDGRLYLTGLSHRAYDLVAGSGKLNLTGPVRAYEVTPIVGASTRQAYAHAQAWIVGQRPTDEPTGGET